MAAIYIQSSQHILQTHNGHTRKANKSIKQNYKVTKKKRKNTTNFDLHVNRQIDLRNQQS